MRPLLLERHTTIDVLKCICAFLVVLIHCAYPYKQHILPITDIAVPLFFVCSGYFVYEKGRNVKRIRRITHIIIWSFAFYLIKTEIFHLVTKKEFFIPTNKDVINLIIFNEVVFSIHLWYLAAYLYVLIIIYFIDKYSLWKYSFYSIIPLLAIGTFIKQHISKTCPEDIFYYRNFLFVGLPYVLTGAYIRNFPTKKTKRMSVSLTIIISFLFFCRYQTCTNFILDDSNLYLLVVLLFMLTLTLDTGKKGCILSYFGQHYSLYIYIFHLVIASTMELLANNFPTQISIYYMYINPLCVFALSIIFTWILKNMKIIHI